MTTLSVRSPLQLSMPLLLALIALGGAMVAAPDMATPFAAGVLTGALLMLLLPSMIAGISGRQSAVHALEEEEDAEGDGERATVFVGNVPYRATAEHLRALFAPYGEIYSVRLMTDRVTRRPRGFGFVELAPAAAERAIRELDGVDLLGRELKVSEGRHRDRNED